MERSYNITIPWQGWKITGELGRGTFGAVFEIERDILGTTEKAAMKVIYIPSDEAMMDSILFSANYDQATAQKSLQKELKKAQQEYVMMNRLKGITNIVSCEDFAYQEREDGVGYIVFIRMELLKSLQKETREKRRRSEFFTRDEVIRIGRDVSRALDVCEQRGLIHRDIKPSNILVSEYGDYKIGDFGTARGLDHTMQATYAGTQSFMAPEVYRREPYGKTVDIYSLGLVMYWLMNRYHMPFVPLDTVPGSEELQIAETRRVQGEQLPPPCDAGSELSQIILKACEPDSTRRYHSASEMYHDLTDLSEGRFIAESTEADGRVFTVASSALDDKSAPVFVPETDDAFDGDEPTLPLIAINDRTVEETVAAPAPVPDPETSETDKASLREHIAQDRNTKHIFNAFSKNVSEYIGWLKHGNPDPEFDTDDQHVEEKNEAANSEDAVLNSIAVDRSVEHIAKPDQLIKLFSVYAACRNEDRSDPKKVKGIVFREVIRSGMISDYPEITKYYQDSPALITDSPDPQGWINEPGIKGYYAVRSMDMDFILKNMFHLDLYIYREPEEGVFYRSGDYYYIFEPDTDDTVHPQVILTKYLSGLFSHDVIFAAVSGRDKTDRYIARIIWHDLRWEMLYCNDVQ